jgi:prepilin-type N-terminal cleavage/methylation domain-containing protein
MKKLISNTSKEFLQAGQNQKGFTFLEVLVSAVILSVGIFGLIKTADSVLFYQSHAKNTTDATLKTANKIEEIKHLSANDPTSGAFGFNYLTTDYLTDESLTRVDSQTYSKSETDEDFTVAWTLQVYPSGTSETFDEPTSIHMLEVLVTTTWTDSRGSGREVELSAVIHRRQFIE